MDTQKLLSNYAVTPIANRQIKLYELSQMPQFDAVISMLEEVAFEFYAQPPRNTEQKVAWETYSYVDFFSRHVLTKMRDEIQQGEFLMNTPTPTDEEKNDARDEGHSGDRPRA